MSFNLKGKRIGIFSDIHIGLNQDNPMWHEIMLDFADWVSKKYIDLGINEIIIPGDIFHNRSEISVNTLSVAKRFFDKLRDFKIFILVGNHDCYYKDRSDINSISLLKGWNNIIIADTSALLAYKDKKISLIPWGTPIDNIPKTDICFGHFEIQTFYMNTYKVCDHGIESTNILNKAPLVISGHFHNRDERVYKNGKIVYVGSPYQQNFGDVDQSRGVYILNLENNELEFIENDISPKHYKIFLSKIKNKTQDINFLKTNIPNNLISFVIDEEIDEQSLSSLSGKLLKLNPRSFRTEYKSEESKLLDNLDNKDYNSIDIENNIQDFVESIDIEHKDEVVNYLKSIYKDLIK
jgi:DNA repair exonuclease SbcCD nuclease subunit